MGGKSVYRIQKSVYIQNICVYIYILKKGGIGKVIKRSNKIKEKVLM